MPMSKKKTTTEKQEHKPRSAQRDASHKKNWKEYMATVEDIQNFLLDSSCPPFLRQAGWPTESRFL